MSSPLPLPKRNKKKKTGKGSGFPDPEEVYNQLLAEYHASQPEPGPYPAPTPLKRRSSLQSPETTRKRKVLFNLKLNQTQHFDKDEVVSRMDFKEKEDAVSPAKGVLKRNTQVNREIIEE